MLILAVGTFYTWFAYGKAKQRGRNPIRWAFVAAATFLGTQLLVAGGIGFILGLGEDLWGWSANLINDYNLHITIVSLLACIVTLDFGRKSSLRSRTTRFKLLIL